MTAGLILHESPNRLRLRYPPTASLTDLRVQLELLPGVASIRSSDSIRSLTVRYDGRRPTRQAILDLAATMATRPAARARPPSAAARSRIERHIPALATAAIPLAPVSARPAVALGALAARTLARPAGERRTAGFLLDTVSLATTALTGHPFTTATSILLGSLADSWQQELLQEVDRLLEHLAPPTEAGYRVNRNGATRRLRAEELQSGDRVKLAAGEVVPADGVIRSGKARVFPITRHEDPQGRSIGRADRIVSGERLSEGRIEYLVEQPASRSHAKRLKEHVRHVTHSRDGRNALTPDLDRLLALPISSAGLVLAMTGDAGRTAAMLQADPQHGLLLSHPIARDAALYSLARQGLLGTGLDTVERLVGATTLAVEDIGVLTGRSWQLSELRAEEPGLTRREVRGWLARLAGIDPQDAAANGFDDRQVAAWLEHGAVLHAPPRVLHVAGPDPLARTWGLEQPLPDRGSLERVLGIVEAGRLLAGVKLRCRLRPGTSRRFEELRALGLRRIAIFTEDLEEQAGSEIESLGADAIVSASREQQRHWLERADEQGERIVLLHTGLRDLLPPGGLSLCPAHAEAGAHGVLLGDPLESLVAARRTAQSLHARLRRHFGLSTTVNAALMVASGLRLIPPIANATLHHASTLWLLRSSRTLARISTTRP
jgi:cation transport ATPase